MLFVKKRKINWRLVTAWGIVAEIVGFLSQQFCGDVKGYYLSINLPPLAPPTWLFGVAWGILYFIMGATAGYIYQLHFKNKALADKQHQANVIYRLQLVMNFFWSIVFFRWQSVTAALLLVIALFALNCYQLTLYRALDKKAFNWLLPYVIWLAFATYLTLGVWILR
ncbi:tryptophan-rich sensory protein [bacterium]|nr:tryptophan-rich sensory protein [bacterium]